MSQAWAICPRCGKVLAVDPVDAPGEPVAMTEHLREHAKDVPPPRSAEGLPPHARTHPRREP